MVFRDKKTNALTHKNQDLASKLSFCAFPFDKTVRTYIRVLLW